MPNSPIQAANSNSTSPNNIEDHSPTTTSVANSGPLHGNPPMIMFAPGAGTFVTKLYSMLEDSSNCDMINWNRNGDAFTILAPTEFSRRLLPVVYKHCQLASFIRQLNMYGFSKISLDMTSITPIAESGPAPRQGSHPEDAASKEKDGYPAEQPMVFKHALFKRGKTHLLSQIKRKTPRSRATANQSESGSHKRSRSPDHLHHHAPSPYHPLLMAHSPYHPMYIGSPAVSSMTASSPVGVYTPYDPPVYDTPDHHDAAAFSGASLISKLAVFVSRLTHLVGRSLPPDSPDTLEASALMSELHQFVAVASSVHHPHHFPPHHPHSSQHTPLPVGFANPGSFMSPPMVAHHNAFYYNHPSTHPHSASPYHGPHFAPKPGAPPHHPPPGHVASIPSGHAPSPYVTSGQSYTTPVIRTYEPPHADATRSAHSHPPVTPSHLSRSTLSPNIAQYTDFTPNYVSDDPRSLSAASAARPSTYPRPVPAPANHFINDHPSSAPEAATVKLSPKKPASAAPSMLPPMFPSLKSVEDPADSFKHRALPPNHQPTPHTPANDQPLQSPYLNTPRINDHPTQSATHQSKHSTEEDSMGVPVVGYTLTCFLFLTCVWCNGCLFCPSYFPPPMN